MLFVIFPGHLTFKNTGTFTDNKGEGDEASRLKDRWMQNMNWQIDK